MRVPRFLAPLAAAAALAVPPAPAQAVNSLTYAWTVDCARSTVTRTDELAGVTLPSGQYLVTVTGGCAFTRGGTSSVPVDTCVYPVATWGFPCVATGVTVENVPRDVCVVGGGIAHAQPCPGRDRGVYLPFCHGYFAVEVNGQCLSEVNHHVGLIDHAGGAMNARVLDSVYGDNTGTFVVTAVWTPL